MKAPTVDIVIRIRPEQRAYLKAWALERNVKQTWQALIDEIIAALNYLEQQEDQP